MRTRKQAIKDLEKLYRSNQRGYNKRTKDKSDFSVNDIMQTEMTGELPRAYTLRLYKESMDYAKEKIKKLEAMTDNEYLITEIEKLEKRIKYLEEVLDYHHLDYEDGEE